MRHMVILLVPVLAVSAADFAQADPVCEQFQLDAYRRAYASADQCWANERRMKGATQKCCDEAFSGGRCPSSSEAQANIDWIFTDAGARSTYGRLRTNGRSAFEAVVGAQAHNPRVQQLLRSCQSFAEAYLARRGEDGAGATLSNRPLSQGDCRCVSVLPTGAADWQGRVGYRVINSCDGLEISVLFGRDIARWSPNPRAFETWAQAGLMGPNEERIVYVPGGTILSINAVGIRNAVNSVTCPML